MLDAGCKPPHKKIVSTHTNHKQTLTTRYAELVISTKIIRVRKREMRKKKE
jgi:hypothetical protein